MQQFAKIFRQKIFPLSDFVIDHEKEFIDIAIEHSRMLSKKEIAKKVKQLSEAENGATAAKFELAKRAKELNLDVIHDTVHEMARDEARHGKAFAGLLKRYFGK